MPKAKPDQVITHRIELQQSERDMLEIALVANAFNQTLESLSPIAVALLDPVKLYGLLTILELADVLDTPLPTLGDIDADNPAAFFGAIRDWLFGREQDGQNREVNQEAAQTAAVTSQEALRRAEDNKKAELESYRDDPTPENWERVQLLQEEENRIRGEQKKQTEIAKSWKNWFWYENGRWPKNYEVWAAKVRGDYYP